jgi:tetratricopeptide (TPR) repeat protein
MMNPLYRPFIALLIVLSLSGFAMANPNAETAKALYDKATALFEQEKRDEALALYDELDRRFGQDASPDVRRFGRDESHHVRGAVAEALLSKGALLGEQKKFDDQIAVSGSDVRVY